MIFEIVVQWTKNKKVADKGLQHFALFSYNKKNLQFFLLLTLNVPLFSAARRTTKTHDHTQVWKQRKQS